MLWWRKRNYKCGKTYKGGGEEGREIKEKQRCGRGREMKNVGRYIRSGEEKDEIQKKNKDV